MGAALVVVSVSVVIVLMVTAAFTLVWRRRLRDVPAYSRDHSAVSH
jgi:hypothetical protein